MSIAIEERTSYFVRSDAGYSCDRWESARETLRGLLEDSRNHSLKPGLSLSTMVVQRTHMPRGE